jgi:hypothetical protein
MAKLCIRGSMRVDPLPNRIDPRGGAVLRGHRLRVCEGQFVVQKFRTAPPHLEAYPRINDAYGRQIHMVVLFTLHDLLLAL